MAFRAMHRDASWWAQPDSLLHGPPYACTWGTYRCYGSLSHAPRVWSAPSDPLDVMVTGERGRPAPVLLVPRSLWGDVVLSTRSQ